MIEMETDRRLDNGECPPIKIVAGNKCDLQGARQIKSQQGLEWARQRRCGFMETSAREMVNIEETFACKSMVALPNCAWKVANARCLSSARPACCRGAQDPSLGRSGGVCSEDELGAARDRKRSTFSNGF